MIRKHDCLATDFYIGIGAMTGTSLDGLDLALCEFGQNSYRILEFQCLEMPAELRKSLASAHTSSSQEYFEIENEYSQYIAEAIKNFHEKTDKRATFAGIHGQTIFHRPEARLTNQMLNGGLIAAVSNLTTVCDFRRSDVALQGQGAPLVPIGDRDLFSEYSSCLNLGGFANLSTEVNAVRTAFDICPVNIVLNFLSNKMGEEYDDGGRMAATGRLNLELLNKLNALPFYKLNPPKSLGREWMEQNILPQLMGIDNSVALRTFTAHAAFQIARNLPSLGKVLITGGGAYNDFLLSQIKLNTPSIKLVVPEKALIEGKEALIFAYLAKLRLTEKINVLASATGATRDSCSGSVYQP